MLSKTEGNSPTLCISRERVYAHMRAHVQTNRKKHAHVRKTWRMCGCAQKKTGWWTVPDEKNNRDTVKFIHNQGHFFKERKEKPEKIRSSPRKNPGFSGSVPLERSVLCHPKNKNFPGIAVFCQPENENFPRTASFMPAEGQKFSENRHFLPTGEQKFSRNGQFYDRRKTKKWTRRPFFLARLGNLDQNSSPERQEIRKKFPEKLETELHVHNQNRDFSMQQGKWRHGNLIPQGHFCTGRPAFFMFPCRETYVLPGGNLRFPTGKPTVSTPET